MDDVFFKKKIINNTKTFISNNAICNKKDEGYFKTNNM